MYFSQSTFIALICSALVCLGSCSSPEPLTSLPSDALLILDSLSISSQIPSEALDLDVKNQSCIRLKTESSSSSKVDLHAHWWEGSCLPPVLSIPFPPDAPKNFTEVEHLGSLNFMARKVQTSRSEPTIIIKLCDTYQNCSSTHIQSRHLLRTKLDTSWQEVIIPFSDLKRGRDATNWSSINHIDIQFEGFGEVEISNIYTSTFSLRKESKKAIKRETAEEPPVGQFYLFKEELNHVWGLGERRNRDFNVKAYQGVNESQALVLEWDFVTPALSRELKTDADGSMGISWNHWISYALPPSLDRSKVNFMLRNLSPRNSATEELPLWIGLSDGDGNEKELNITPYLTGRNGGWQECEILLSEFYSTSNLDTEKELEYLFFKTKKKGHVLLDNLKVIF